MAGKNTYQYTTFILAVVLVAVITAFLFYMIGYESAKSSSSVTSIVPTLYTTIATAKTQTSSLSTISGSIGCQENDVTLVTVGNNLACGSFEAKLVSVNSSNQPDVAIYYNGSFTGKNITNETGNIGHGMGDEGYVTQLNVSGTTLYVLILGASSKYQTAYIEMSTDLYNFVTSVYTTSASSTSSAATTTINS